jgi:hypothetical protein
MPGPPNTVGEGGSVSSPWNERKRGGGREGTHRTKPTYRAAVQIDQRNNRSFPRTRPRWERGRTTGQGISAVENERERACRSVGVEAVAADLLFLFRTLAFVGFFLFCSGRTSGWKRKRGGCPRVDSTRQCDRVGAAAA